MPAEVKTSLYLMRQGFVSTLVFSCTCHSSRVWACHPIDKNMPGTHKKAGNSPASPLVRRQSVSPFLQHLDSLLKRRMTSGPVPENTCHFTITDTQHAGVFIVSRLIGPAPSTSADPASARNSRHLENASTTNCPANPTVQSVNMCTSLKTSTWAPLTLAATSRATIKAIK